MILANVLSVASNSETGKKGEKEKSSRITFTEDNAGKKIDVMVDGKLFPHTNDQIISVNQCFTRCIHQQALWLRVDFQ